VIDDKFGLEEVARVFNNVQDCQDTAETLSSLMTPASRHSTASASSDQSMLNILNKTRTPGGVSADSTTEMSFPEFQEALATICVIKHSNPCVTCTLRCCWMSMVCTGTALTGVNIMRIMAGSRLWTAG